MTRKVAFDDDLLDGILKRVKDKFYEVVLPVINNFANQVSNDQIEVDYDPETGLHVIPKHDDRSHEVSARCWCNPTKDLDVAVYTHNDHLCSDEWATIVKRLNS